MTVIATPKKVLKPIAKVPPKPAAPTKVIGSEPNPDPVQPIAKKVEVVQPQATVTHQYKDGTSTEAKEDFGPPVQLDGPHATVSVQMGLTRNLGDYNNIKVGVFLSVPCDVNNEAIDTTYLKVKGWVDMRIEQLNEEISAQIG